MSDRYKWCSTMKMFFDNEEGCYVKGPKMAAYMAELQAENERLSRDIEFALHRGDKALAGSIKKTQTIEAMKNTEADLESEISRLKGLCAEKQELKEENERLNQRLDQYESTPERAIHSFAKKFHPESKIVGVSVSDDGENHGCSYIIDLTAEDIEE